MTLHTRIPLREGLLFAFALSLFACQVGEGNRDDLKLLSNGPDLPEECDTCWEDFKDCFDAGQPIEDCEDQIVECVLSCEAPPPPPECDHCSAGYEACTEAAGDGEANASDCAAGLESCLGVCASPDPPEPDDCAQCEANYLECVGQGGMGSDSMDEDSQNGECDDLLAQCQMQCVVPPDPDCGTCDAELEACLEMAGDMNDMEQNGSTAEQCHQAHNLCLQTCEQGDNMMDLTCNECISEASECVGADGDLDTSCLGGLAGCFDACGIDDQMSCQLLYDYCYDVADQSTCDAILDSLAQSCADSEEPVCQLYQAACGDM